MLVYGDQEEGVEEARSISLLQDEEEDDDEGGGGVDNGVCRAVGQSH